MEVDHRNCESKDQGIDVYFLYEHTIGIKLIT